MEEDRINPLDKPRSFKQYEHAGNQPDVYVRCPYFPEHELRRSRLPYHLIKCQANPRAPKLLVCPFNYMHRVKPEEKHEHIVLCEDRIYTKFSNKGPPSVGRTRAEIEDEATFNPESERVVETPQYIPRRPW